MLFTLLLLSQLPLISFAPSATSSNSMIVTWGRPSNYSTPDDYSASSWRDCVSICYKTVSCVVAYTRLDGTSCQLFSANRIWTVSRLDSSEGLVVAFKVDNSLEGCPTGEPTLDNGTAYGSSSDSTGNYTHNVTFDGSQWTLSFQNVLTCETGWTTFHRPLTDWCVQVFGGPDVEYTQDEAVQYCAGNGAVLSGLETQDERFFVVDTAYSLLGPSYSQFSGFWISGVRKPECSELDWQSIPYCSDDIRQFDYSDQYLSTYSGITWDLDQPDRNKSGVWQNCMQVWIRQPGLDPNWTYSTQPTGAADDQQCDLSAAKGYSLRGMVCGKLPQVPL